MLATRYQRGDRLQLFASMNRFGVGLMVPTEREMPVSHGGELLKDYNFAVAIDGMDQLHFSEVSGLNVEVGVVEFRSGADADTVGRVVPGRVKYGPVTLERGVARDLQLWEWLSNIESGQADARQVTISILGTNHETAAAFVLHGAWPSRLELGKLEGKGNSIAIERLELTYERLQVDN